MNCAIRNAYRFMREHAGSVVGHNAEGALRLARAEALLGEALDLDIASIEWLDDDMPYEQGIFTDEEVRAKFESNEWTGPYGCIVGVGACTTYIVATGRTESTREAETSLWGIVVGPRGTNDPHCRVVQAELALDVLDELRQAIGDTRDAEQHTCYA